ncbi:hypothetical protein [Carp edema virus]|nr:hypothetical protein [Carp edema virus]
MPGTVLKMDSATFVSYNEFLYSFNWSTFLIGNPSVSGLIVQYFNSYGKNIVRITIYASDRYGSYFVITQSSLIFRLLKFHGVPILEFAREESNSGVVHFWNMTTQTLLSTLKSIGLGKFESSKKEIFISRHTNPCFCENVKFEYDNETTKYWIKTALEEILGKPGVKSLRSSSLHTMTETKVIPNTEPCLSNKVRTLDKLAVMLNVIQLNSTRCIDNYLDTFVYPHDCRR